jgi:hypothetical protein
MRNFASAAELIRADSLSMTTPARRPYYNEPRGIFHYAHGLV